MLRRICSTCKENKVLSSSFFHLDTKGKEGFSASCKLCRNSKKRVKPYEDIKQSKNIIEEAFVTMPNVKFTEMKLSKSQQRRLAVMHAKTAADRETFDKESDLMVGGNVQIEQEDVFDTLLKKFGCHFSISCDKVGRGKLTVHSNPTRTWKEESVREVIEKALI